MKGKIIHTLLVGILLAAILCSCQSTKDENLDRAVKSIDPETMMFIENMGVGWNAGNTLEAIGGETAWGNPMLHQTIFNAVKAAGFNTVRLPVAWSKFSDETNFIIDSSWMARVKEVVHYALNAGLYVIINIHWDGGWIQPTYAKESYVNKRLGIMWKQIATNFRDFDNRLLFAGTNEVMVENEWGPPTEEYSEVQNGFNQTFVTTVRKTGGNNRNRYLIVQGFNTNIDYTVAFTVMPKDTASDRLMIEVHYYDPYNFTLNTKSKITQWGSIATDPTKTEPWADEAWVDSQFEKMKSEFIDRGIPVILGEYSVISRLSVDDHEIYRVYWNQYVTQSAVNHGMVPIYWDNGYSGDGGLALFDRNSGRQLYPDIINAIVGAVNK
jgi:endoglucanase